MGQPAFKIEDDVEETASAEIIPLKTASAAPLALRQALAAGPARSDVPGLLNMISRASSLLGNYKERSEVMENRAVAAEELLKAANRRIAESEGKLRAALEEARLERERAAELQRRSGEVVERTRSMLSEAGERMRAAESRADRAESKFNTLRNALEQGLGAHLGLPASAASAQV